MASPVPAVKPKPKPKRKPAQRPTSAKPVPGTPGTPDAQQVLTPRTQKSRPQTAKVPRPQGRFGAVVRSTHKQSGRPVMGTEERGGLQLAGKFSPGPIYNVQVGTVAYNNSPCMKFSEADPKPLLAPTCSPGPACVNLRAGKLPGSMTYQVCAPVTPLCMGGGVCA